MTFSFGSDAFVRQSLKFIEEQNQLILTKQAVIVNDIIKEVILEHEEQSINTKLAICIERIGSNEHLLKEIISYICENINPIFNEISKGSIITIPVALLSDDYPSPLSPHPTPLPRF